MFPKSEWLRIPNVAKGTVCGGVVQEVAEQRSAVRPHKPGSCLYSRQHPIFLRSERWVRDVLVGASGCRKWCHPKFFTVHLSMYRFSRRKKNNVVLICWRKGSLFPRCFSQKRSFEKNVEWSLCNLEHSFGVHRYDAFGFSRWWRLMMLFFSGKGFSVVFMN